MRKLWILFGLAAISVTFALAGSPVLAGAASPAQDADQAETISPAAEQAGTLDAAAGFSAAKARGLELLRARNYAAAYPLYMDLLRQEPEDFEVNLLAARAARGAGKLNHARILYERSIEAAPNEAGLRVELAEVLTLQGKPEEARLIMQDARALDNSLDSGIFGPLAKAVDSRTNTFSFSGRLSAGILYDSNINGAPDNRGINLGGIPLLLDNRNTAEEAMGTFFQAGLDMAWRNSAETNWWVVADATGYQRWNFDASPRRDLTYGRGAVGIRHLNQSHLIELRFKAETLLENEDSAQNIFGGEINSVLVVSPSLQNIARLGVEYRKDYLTDAREGGYFFFSEYLRWFFGEGNHSLMAGFKAYTGHGRIDRHRYFGAEPGVYLTFNLPEDITLTGSVAWHREMYQDTATVMDIEDRQDDQWKLSVFVDKKLTENFSIYAGWQYSDNQSNSDLYDYDQHQLMTGVAYKF